MKRNVLIVVDMQNDFVTGSLGSAQAQAIVPNVVEKIAQYEKEGCPVIYTRDTHSEKYLETVEGQHLPVPHCIEGTEGHKLIPEITSATIENIVDKVTFGYNGWEEYLLTKGINNFDDVVFELCGLCTDICVVSNALILKAIFTNADFRVDAKATAGVTEESYKAALTVMKSCHITVYNED